VGQRREVDRLRQAPWRGQDDVAHRAVAGTRLQKEGDLPGVIDRARPHPEVLDGEAEHDVAGADDRAERVVADEEPGRRPRGCQPSVDSWQAMIGAGIIMGQPRYDSLLTI